MREKFDIEKSMYGYNPVFISRLLDPYTARTAKIFYDSGFTPNFVSIIGFILGILSLLCLFDYSSYGYVVLIVSAILLTARNICDTIDGKIARGGNMKTKVGGFLDISTDWLFFHAIYFIGIGILTNHTIIGFLCVTGYMSRESGRRFFEKISETKAEKTESGKKLGMIVKIVKCYDLSSVFWLIPIFILTSQLELVIYGVAIIEYGLLFGELMIDYSILNKLDKNER